MEKNNWERRLELLASIEAKSRKEAVKCLLEVHRRELWKEGGYKSLREYCMKGLGYDEFATRGLLAACGFILNSSQMKDSNPSVQKRINGLKEWRRQKSKELHMTPYLILSNRTIMDLAREKPKKLDELSLIDGIGEKKLELYGREILKTISAIH